jgi:hypothetical protein
MKRLQKLEKTVSKLKTSFKIFCNEVRSNDYGKVDQKAKIEELISDLETIAFEIYK